MSEQIAKAFHESYERLAPDFGYKTREASAVPWEHVPARNRELMVAVVTDLVEQGVIRRPLKMRGTVMLSVPEQK